MLKTAHAGAIILPNQSIMMQSKRYALIDDDPVYRAVMKRAGTLEGMEVDVFESLADLGTIGMLGQYDAAIVDYDLGALSGVEIAAYLTAFKAKTPMVLVSSLIRDPGLAGWPPSVRRFVTKDLGYEYVLKQAIKCANET